MRMSSSFSAIMRMIARRSAPFFYGEKFDELYRKMTFILRGFKSPLRDSERQTRKSLNEEIFQ